LKKTPKKAMKMGILAPERTQKRPGAPEGALGAKRSNKSAQTHAWGR